MNDDIVSPWRRSASFSIGAMRLCVTCDEMAGIGSRG